MNTQKVVAHSQHIRATFEKLLLRKAEVTTLDIKEELRDLEYWATQDDVSKEIQTYFEELTLSGNLTRTQVGKLLKRRASGQGYQIYYLDSVPSFSPVAPKPKQSAAIGNWSVWASFTPASVISNTTRNKARSDYAKQFGIDYIDVRARKA